VTLLELFQLLRKHLGIVIADVSGKGIPAALFMMSSMIIINNFAMLGFSPKEVLEKANAKICSSNVLNMFVTVWFGILDLKTGTVTAANAGHEYPAIEKRETGFELLKDKHGLVIGGMEGVTYKEYSFTLDKEESIFVYTDGVAEATDAQDQLYGTDRMLAALNRAKGKSVGDICGAVAEDINRFVKDAPQFDDITMVCIRYHGPRE
jgi:sigma-B regulation protein RsbU (phosphoserine phosphatase)